MVTLISQDLSEFALHARAILGLPVPEASIPVLAPAASAVVLGSSEVESPTFSGADEALRTNELAAGEVLDLRLFGKPLSTPGRRLGVALARAADCDRARQLAVTAAAQITVDR